jgi:transposase-like protein
VYYGLRDARLHALVGDGLHHGADTIQYLRCQACHTKVSVRRDTPMYNLKTLVARVDEVVTATSEGVDVAAASRIFKHDERTIQRWLARMAAHSQRRITAFSATWSVSTCNWMSWSPSCVA